MPAATEYHEAFWVAVATGAPVIGLAHLFAFGTAYSSLSTIVYRQFILEARKAKRAGSKSIWGSPATWATICAVIAIMMDCVLLLFALDSLAAEHDQHSLTIARFMMFYTMLGILLTAGLVERSKAWVEEVNNEWRQALTDREEEAYQLGREKGERELSKLKDEAEALTLERDEYRRESQSIQQQWRDDGLPEPKLFDDHYENIFGEMIYKETEAITRHESDDA